MSDIDGRFARLQRAAPPDLWPRITTTEPGREEGPRPPRRVLTAMLALVVAGAGVAFAVQALRGGPPVDSPSPNPLAAAPEDLIAFVRGDPYHVAVVSPEDGAVTDLTQPEGMGFDVSAQWSPDGTRIAFARYIVQDEVNGLGEYAVFVAEADGSSPRQLTPPGAGAFAWSPDGTAIAYTRIAGPAANSVWVAGLDGSDAHVVRGYLSGRAAWGARGELLVERWRHEPGGPGLYAVRPDGTGMRRILDREAWGAAWSPDGARITFASRREGHAEIRVVDAAGGNDLLAYEAPTGDAGSPAWSPDGRNIAFELHDGESWEVGVAEADGSGGAIVAASPDDESGPVWSPDGERLAFSRAPACGGCDNSGSSDIVLVNPDGTEAVALTSGAHELGSSLMWRPSGPPEPVAEAPRPVGEPDCGVVRTFPSITESVGASARRGAPGDRILLWADSLRGEDGRYAPAGGVEVVWNADVALTAVPDAPPLRPGPTVLMAEHPILGRCDWAVEVTIPQVQPGRYAITVLTWDHPRSEEYGLTGRLEFQVDG